jgi:hypothetical protein
MEPIKIKKKEQKPEDNKKAEKVLSFDLEKDESKLEIPTNQPAYDKENNNYNLLTFLTSKHKPDVYFGGEVIKSRNYKVRTAEEKPIEEASAASESDNLADLRKKDIRYFDANNITIKCFNCGGIGHMARSCPNEVIRTCTRCNEQGHDEYNCPNVKCFKCNRIGHKSFECRAGRDIEKCSSCKNVGHLAEDCLSKPIPITTKDLEKNKLTACRFCGKNGHLICPFPKTPYIIEDYNSDHVILSDEEEGEASGDEAKMIIEDLCIANTAITMNEVKGKQISSFKSVLSHRSEEKSVGRTPSASSKSSKVVKKKKNYSGVIFCPNCAERHKREHCTQTGRSNEFDQRRQIHSRNMFRTDTNTYYKK